MKKLEKWQWRKLLFWFLTIVIVATAFLTYTVRDLYHDKKAENTYWEKYLHEEVKDEAWIEEISKNATEVATGTYVETLKEISLKNSNFRVVAKVWFRWEGNDKLDMANNFHVYNGTINKREIITESHENGMNYQLCRMDVTVFKNYWTKRFPLESHQLRFYIEPDYIIDEVKLVNDRKHTGVNPSLSIAGYKLSRCDHSVHPMNLDSTFGDPKLERGTVKSEYLTAIEINREGFGLYAKCFIALIGTTLWIYITLFICTYHKVDPLGMIPAALFGTVSNIMVGANLLPDALEIGLLEYVNVWGIFTILSGALIVININRIRTKYQDAHFAALFGRIMFYTSLALTILGHILLPWSAYISSR